MAWPPVLGELWVSLEPTDKELIVTGSRREYQRFVIFKSIQEFGINTQVYVQHERQESTRAHTHCIKNAASVGALGLQQQLSIN
jgi:hypothetical protein